MDPNAWLAVNKKRVDNILKQFEFYRMKVVGDSEINFLEAISLFRGLSNETSRLQRDNDILKNEVEKLKLELKTLKGGK